MQHKNSKKLQLLKKLNNKSKQTKTNVLKMNLDCFFIDIVISLQFNFVFIF